jgi:hypothetical protein
MTIVPAEIAFAPSFSRVYELATGNMKWKRKVKNERMELEYPDIKLGWAGLEVYLT